MHGAGNIKENFEKLYNLTTISDAWNIMFDKELNPQFTNHVVLIFSDIFRYFAKSDVYLEPCQTSKMELKTVNYFGKETPL